MVAKFAFSMLAKKIARIAFALFVVLVVLYFAWVPVTGNLVQNDVGPSRQIWGCDPAEDPCCGEPYNTSNASWANPYNFTDVVCWPEARSAEACISGFAMLMLIIAIAAAVGGKMLAPKMPKI